MDQFNAPQSGGALKITQSGGALKITQYAVFIVYQVENNHCVSE